jgi:beta-aspartyl-dipeptidase (metallo-type)
MYTGSYHLPVKTLTGTVESDIMLIPEVLGWGGGHQRSQIQCADPRRAGPAGEQARVAGLLAGKSGSASFTGGQPRGVGAAAGFA